MENGKSWQKVGGKLTEVGGKLIKVGGWFGLHFLQIDGSNRSIERETMLALKIVFDVPQFFWKSENSLAEKNIAGYNSLCCCFS